MRIEFLDNITGKWAKQWIVGWFVFGFIAVNIGFWTATERSGLDWFYLGMSIVGLLCVVSLSFRKNIAGNGLGMVANSGEVVVQGTSGAVGLMLVPMFNFFTHVYGLFYWSKNTDADGDMIPKSANKWVWLVTIAFIAIGLALFPIVNDWLASMNYSRLVDDDADAKQLLGWINFFWLNVIAFVLGIVAQVTMILRYSFSWWIWILVNVVYFVVNIMTDNTIFAIQAVVYEINAIIGLYEWYRRDQAA